MKVTFLRMAEAELDEAIEHYETQQRDLGERFRGQVFRAIGRIADFPEAYQPLAKRTRRCLIAKFPYGIIFPA